MMAMATTMHCTSFMTSRYDCNVVVAIVMVFDYFVEIDYEPLHYRGNCQSHNNYNDDNHKISS